MVAVIGRVIPWEVRIGDQNTYVEVDITTPAIDIFVNGIRVNRWV
uniref:Uncharacterized protein n=1 Tax=viral metagenome TaxID=1070528 RepID=A0A6H1ZYQ8_9ZZZZ